MPRLLDDDWDNGLDGLEAIAARVRKSLSADDADEKLFLAVFDRWADRGFAKARSGGSEP